MEVVMSIPVISLQKYLFDHNPLRSELIKVNNDCCQKYSIKVYRNHSFELISSVIPAYLKYAGMNIEFHYSDYDDSFSFFDFSDAEDAVLLWIDLSRYAVDDVETFVADRIKDIKNRTSKPVLVVTTGRRISLEKEIFSFDLDSLEQEIGEGFFDLKREPITGTKLSNKACLVAARELGTKYFPALFQPALKAIVVDLDNTLYKGVLGEDGIEGIELTSAHALLQEKLAGLAAQGFFICIVSKNEQSDVEKMFDLRSDFPLQKSALTFINASWQAKSKSILDIAARLNIGTDSMLFIDDNMGELSEVFSHIPDIHLIHAQDNASATLRALSCFPGLLKIFQNKEDTLRQSDVQANEQRRKLQENFSHEEYLRNLKMELRILLDDEVGKARIAELSNKTNQFIFTYRRYTLAQVEALIASRDSVIVSLHLRDKLSDSGMIGALVLLREGDTAILDEMYISCRALGRGIDDIIIFEAISDGLKKLSVNKLQVNFVKGERNRPAEMFYQQYLEDYAVPTAFEPLPQSNLVHIIHEGENNE